MWENHESSHLRKYRWGRLKCNQGKYTWSKLGLSPPRNFGVLSLQFSILHWTKCGVSKIDEGGNPDLTCPPFSSTRNQLKSPPRPTVPPPSTAPIHVIKNCDDYAKLVGGAQQRVSEIHVDGCAKHDSCAPFLCIPFRIQFARYSLHLAPLSYEPVPSEMGKSWKIGWHFLFAHFVPKLRAWLIAHKSRGRWLVDIWINSLRTTQDCCGMPLHNVNWRKWLPHLSSKRRPHRLVRRRQHKLQRSNEPMAQERRLDVVVSVYIIGWWCSYSSQSFGGMTRLTKMGWNVVHHDPILKSGLRNAMGSFLIR